jgi:hypothetical protein
MSRIILALVLVAFLGAPVLGQTTIRSGDVFHGPNGATIKSGDVYHGPDGGVKVGDVFHGSNGTTYTTTGGVVHGSDGSTTIKIGDTYTTSGGKGPPPPAVLDSK